MAAELVNGYMREISQHINLLNNDIPLEIIALCYNYYRHFLHTTFGYFDLSESNFDLNGIAECLVENKANILDQNQTTIEMFMNHQRFRLINAASLIPAITICDTVIFNLSSQENELEIDWNNFEKSREFGVNSFVVICSKTAIFKIKSRMKNGDNVEFVDINKMKNSNEISVKISETINHIRNDRGLYRTKQILSKQSLLVSIDNGFNTKLISNSNKITKIFTGQIIRGNIKIGDKIKFVKKTLKYQHFGIVKSIQINKKPVGILQSPQIGDYVGIGMEFDDDFNVGGKGDILMNINHTLSTNKLFEVEFKEVDEAFLLSILRYFDDDHAPDDRGYYPRIDCSRVIHVGHMKKGCILRRIRLIDGDGGGWERDSRRMYVDGRWGKNIYWEGYDAKLVFEGNIFVSTYKESKYFGTICMSHGDTTIGFGKVVSSSLNDNDLTRFF
eukprot:316425_1